LSTASKPKDQPKVTFEQLRQIALARVPTVTKNLTDSPLVSK